MDSLVTASWLAARLGSPDLAILDATVYFPQEGRQARAEYLAAHIPGARFFDIDEVADPDTTLPHMVPSQGRFARLVSALGIGNRQHVVFYDQKGLFSAARGWWLFRLFGHERVSVLDGGLPAWRRIGGPLQSGPPPTADPAATAVSAPYQPVFNATLLRGLGDLRRNLDSRQAIVLDARSADRFAGIAPEPRPGVASGHIPGSRSLPYEKLLNADQTLKTPRQLRSIFAAEGVGEDAGADAHATRDVVTSCGSGLTAAIISLGLDAAGLPIGALYDGSWAEWGARSDTPKATNETAPMFRRE